MSNPTLTGSDPHVHACTHTLTHTHTHTYMHPGTHTHRHTRARIPTHTRTHTHHTLKPLCVFLQILPAFGLQLPRPPPPPTSQCSHTHTDAYIQALTHTHTHTHTPTHAHHTLKPLCAFPQILPAFRLQLPHPPPPCLTCLSTSWFSVQVYHV